jgi:hypothetical protein
MNKAVKFLAGTLATVFAGFGIYASVEQIKYYRNNKVPALVESRNLVVNTANDKRYKVWQSEDDGVRKIVEHVFSSRLEDAWLYAPQMEFWLEYGKDESYSGLIEATTNLDIPVFCNMAFKHDALTHYHFHPYNQNNIETLVKEQVGRINKRSSNAFSFKEFERAIQYMINVEYSAYETVPSAADLDGLVKQSLLFYRIKPKGSFKYRICSGGGITECTVTDEGMKHFGEYTTQELGKYCQGKALKMSKLAFESALPAPDKFNTDLRARELVAMMSDDNISITYTPYKEFFDMQERIKKIKMVPMPSKKK